MRFAVESWDPAYGSAIDSLDLELAAVEVDPTIEVLPDRWAPVPCTDGTGTPAAEVETIWFVDGVRRIDARVWIEDGEGGGAKSGVCASVAAGAVRVADGRAEVTEVLVERGLYTTSEGVGPILTSAGTYELRATTTTTPEATYQGIHDHMTELEKQVTTSAGRDHLIVVDGPLRGRSGRQVVGYVKTQHVQYLAGESLTVLAQLEPGERTPLILLGGRQTRYAWYLRLGGPRPHRLAGIVRCEAPAVGDVAHAAACASAVTAALLRFASEPHKDPRAPQNLYPIAGLERRLRHHLGDPQLLERALRVASRMG